jgi:hypothetical protein
MPRNTSPTLNTAKNQGNLKPAYLWKLIYRDEVTIKYFTSHQKNVPFSGDTYLANVGFNPKALETTDELGAVPLEHKGFFLDNTTILRDDIFAGRLMGARFEYYLCMWDNPENTAHLMSKGFVGEIRHTATGFEIALKDLMIGFDVVSGMKAVEFCQSDLGNPFKCGVKLQASAWTPSTAATARRDRLMRKGTVVRATPGSWAMSTVYSAGTFVFANGLFFRSGGGTSGGSEPTWPSSPGGTVVDNTITWTATSANYVPSEVWFICTTAGTTGETEPTWDTTEGNTTTETLTSATWVTATSYPAGSTLLENGLIFVSDGGTSGGVEPTWPDDPGDTVADNDIIWTAFSAVPAVWTAIRAHGVSGIVTSVTNELVFIDTDRNEADNNGGWWSLGRLTWTSGDNVVGAPVEVTVFDLGTNTFTLKLPQNSVIQVGDTYEVLVGCNKFSTNCINRFDNMDAFRGPMIIHPGKKAVEQAPDFRAPT